MENITFSSAGVTGKIKADQQTLEKIINDKFTAHYLPDFRLLEENIETDITIKKDDSQEAKKASLNYPEASLSFSVEHRSYVVTAEYLVERARQEKLRVYTLNSAAAEISNRGIIFYGAASNLGKSTFALALAESGFNHFSDEKTLIELESGKMFSGSRSIPLRKEIWSQRFKSEKEYKPINLTNINLFPVVEMMILPHYDNGLARPIINDLDPLDLFWGLCGAMSGRIRGTTRFIDNFSYQLPSLDTEALTQQRVRLVKKFTTNTKGYYFQGNSNQLTNFVKERFGIK